MESSNQIRLRFTGVDFINVNFSSVKVFNEDEDKVALDIQPKVFFPEDNYRQFKIIMDVKIGCPDFFEMALVAMGNFEFSEDVEDSELKRKLVNVNAVGIVFPYIRAFISSFTSNLGGTIKPIVIPTQFFRGELEELKLSVLENEKEKLIQ